MRDLQADPELCNKATVIKMALAERERADKAEKLSKMLSDYDKWLSTRLVASLKLVDKLEALNADLVEALEKAIEEVSHPIFGPGSVVGELEEVLDKAKEVRGDDALRVR